MLEAPIAIIALCSPAINQLVARAIKYRSLTSLFTSPNPDSGRSGSGKSGVSGSTSTSGAGVGFSKIGSATTGSTTAINVEPERFGHDGAAGFEDPDLDTEPEPDIPRCRIGMQRDIEIARYKAKYQVSPV